MSAQTSPWARFEATAREPWDLGKVAHLHRRAGFGATWSELQRDLRDGLEASVKRFLEPRPASEDEEQVRESLRQGVLETHDAERLKAWWLYRILYDPDPLREKLTLFWHSHFATSNRKVNSIPLMLAQNELLRKNALGSFRDLLVGVARDGAMLLWLDGAGSKKEKPNENFARELLELFTLGIGHYSEKDIRAAARAFTGWTRLRSDDFRGTDTFRFDADQLDVGSKTFLGKTGPWKAEDIIRITLEQWAAAERVCRKLYRFLVSEKEEPSDDLLRPLAAELRSADYSIRHVVGMILRSRHFYSRAVVRQRIKSPVEFSAGLIRMLEVPRTDVRLLALAAGCERQGQDLFYPPSVKGWDGGKTWLNSTTLLDRGNWCNDVVWGNPDLGMPAYDPLAWAGRQGIEPKQAAASFVTLLLQNDLDEEAHALILRRGGAGSADALRKAVQLILNCPEYQLA